MEIPGLKKVADAIGDAFSVFDFSFFISGAVTLSFIAIDLHYYGYDGVLKFNGWESVVICIVAIYICGLMSWSCGKLMRWGILRLIWGKDGVKNDFNKIFEKTRRISTRQSGTVGSVEDSRDNNDVDYTKMWIEIEKKDNLAGKYTALNRMWVMVAIYEGLVCSWFVGLLVYLDGCLIGDWITTKSIVYNLIPPLVLLCLICISLHRATVYSRDLIKEVVVTYYNMN